MMRNTIGSSSGWNEVTPGGKSKPHEEIRSNDKGHAIVNTKDSKYVPLLIFFA